MKLSSPLKWYGSKSRLCRWLRFYVPQHRRYCEVFGGGGSLLFQKLRAPAETYNDADPWLVKFFEVLRDDCDALQARLQSMDFAEIESIFGADYPSQGSDLDKAAYFFVNNRASFSGEMHGRRCFAIRAAGNRPRESKYSVYRNSIAKLPLYAERLAGVSLRNETFEEIIPRFNRPTDLLYCDPPYLHSTRTTRGKKCYRYEMADGEHETLLKLLLKSDAQVILSGYVWNFNSGEKNELYLDTLKDWFTSTLGLRTMAGRWNRRTANTDYREEVLWLNPLARETLAQHGSDLLRSEQARLTAA